MTTAPVLPAHGVQSAEDRRQICRRMIIHAREELEAGNRLQAGEKAWGAVVQPLRPSQNNGAGRISRIGMFVK